MTVEFSTKQDFEDGYADVNGLKLYYKRFGKGNKNRLLALHGGPGGTHDYLLPLADLSDRDFDVVLYDQFGCGKSDDPASDADYTLEYAVEEVEGFRKAIFGDKKVNLFGNSWGGMLALAYAIKYQKNLINLISSSGLSSVPQTVNEMKRLISLLPDRYRNSIQEHEKKGDFDHPAYKEASEYFMRQHLLRMEQIPMEVAIALSGMEKRGTYLKMNGPSEFTIVGTIKDIDFTDRLNEIKCRTLITCGKYDEVTPLIAETLHSNIPQSTVRVFPESSHMQFWEQRSEYMNAIADFVGASGK